MAISAIGRVLCACGVPPAKSRHFELSFGDWAKSATRFATRVNRTYPLKSDGCLSRASGFAPTAQQGLTLGESRVVSRCVVVDHQRSDATPFFPLSSMLLCTSCVPPLLVKVILSILYSSSCCTGDSVHPVFLLLLHR